MSFEDTQITLADICTDVSYGYTESATFEEVGPKFLRITDIQGGCFDWQKVPFCPASPQDSEKYRLEVGDIVVARTGNSTGENAQVFSPPPPAVFASYLIRFRPDNQRINPFFVGYQLRTERFRQHVLSVRGGSAQPGANAKQLGAFPVQVIDRSQQNEVVNALRTLDDRITLLRETNQTLEAIAQALFKSWFVDFDPVRAKADGKLPEGIDAATAELFPDAFEESEFGLVPKGWRVGTVESICDTITNGGTPSRSNKEYWSDGAIPWFKTGELSDGFLLAPSERITQLAIASTSVKVLPPNAVLMAIYAAPTVGRLGILTEPAAFNQACTGMVPKQVIGSWFLYWTLYFGRDWFNSRANGAAQQNISKVIVSNYKLVIPDERVLDAFKIICEALHSKIRTSSIQAQTLSNLRDTLLPRLISGQLRIADAEAELEKAVA